MAMHDDGDDGDTMKGSSSKHEDLVPANPSSSRCVVNNVRRVDGDMEWPQSNQHQVALKKFWHKYVVPKTEPEQEPEDSGSDLDLSLEDESNPPADSGDSDAPIPSSSKGPGVFESKPWVDKSWDDSWENMIENCGLQIGSSSLLRGRVLGVWI